MSLKDIKALLETLRESGADAWTVMCVIFGVAIITAGPAYFRVLAAFLNRRREVNGNLDRKLKKLDHELAQKQEKALRRTAEVAAPPAKEKRAVSGRGKKP